MVAKLKALLIYWHLLSLDAPTVATLWTWFIARSVQVRLAWTSLAAMALAVWMLYAADRLLDVRGEEDDQFEQRHYFHQRHRKAFLTGIALVSVALAWLLPTIPTEAMRLYLTLGGLVAGYFIVIHATQSAGRLPKEIAVGVCFAAAVFIPTVARAPHLRMALLAPALLLAALCSLNCLFIYAWEHVESAAQQPHPLTFAALHRLPSITVAVALLGGALAAFDHRTPWVLGAAVAVAAALLLCLHAVRRGPQAVVMRAAADLALLTPLLLMAFG